MKKKAISSFLVALMIAGTSSFSAFATMANGSIVIGSKSFDLAYANDVANSTEITNAIIGGGLIYVKDFSGNWIDNTTGKTVDASIVPGGEAAAAVVMVTVKAESFGAEINATSTQEGATQYQIFDGTTALSAISNLETDTTIFPGKGVGDKVTIKLLNADGTIVATTDVNLVAPGSKVTTSVTEPTTSVTEPTTPVTKPKTPVTKKISAPIGDALCPSGLGFYLNYADGVKMEWSAKNYTGKTINYYTTNISMYNAVGDPAYSEITGKSKIALKTVGPVLPNDPLMIFSIVAYSPVCSKIVIDSIYLQYSDGTTATIPYGYSGTDTLYNPEY